MTKAPPVLPPEDVQFCSCGIGRNRRTSVHGIQGIHFDSSSISAAITDSRELSIGHGRADGVGIRVGLRQSHVYASSVFLCVESAGGKLRISASGSFPRPGHCSRWRFSTSRFPATSNGKSQSGRATAVPGYAATASDLSTRNTPEWPTASGVGPVRNVIAHLNTYLRG